MPRRHKYANRVKILKYVKAGEKWRFANVVEKNGKLVRDHVLISGFDEHHPEGTYYIEWYEIGNRRRRKAVLNFAAVVEEARRKAIEVEAVRAGVVENRSAPASIPSARLGVGTAIDNYLEFIENHRSPRTYLTYRYTLITLFRQSCTTQSVEDVSRGDILKFMTHCYTQGLGHRTVYDKLVVVLQMLKRYDKTKLIQASDWPNYVEKIRVIYEPEEIQAMLRHADDEEAIFLKFMVGSGFRDREAQHVTWRDIDFHNSVVRVTTKPIWGFKPKNWEERCVPLPTALIQQLQAVKERRAALPSQLVFPNSRGNLNTETDVIVNRVAERNVSTAFAICIGRGRSSSRMCPTTSTTSEENWTGRLSCQVIRAHLPTFLQSRSLPSFLRQLTFTNQRAAKERMLPGASQLNGLAPLTYRGPPCLERYYPKNGGSRHTTGKMGASTAHRTKRQATPSASSPVSHARTPPTFGSINSASRFSQPCSAIVVITATIDSPQSRFPSRLQRCLLLCKSAVRCQILFNYMAGSCSLSPRSN